MQGEPSNDTLHAAGYGPPGGPPPGGGYPGGPPMGGPPGFGPPPGGGGYGPPPGGGGYGPPPGGGFPPPPMGMGGGYGGAPSRMSGLAIGSMITGIIAPLTCCCQPVSGPLSITALVLGIISLSKIKSSNGSLRGGGMAIAGIVLGGIGILMTLIGLLSSFDESLRQDYGGSFR